MAARVLGAPQLPLLPDIPVCLIVFVANVSQAQSDIAGKIETRRVLAERYAALSLPLMPNDIEEASAES